jgi:DNA-binding NtrC family response regulator
VLLVVADDLYARALDRWLSRRGWRVTRVAAARNALSCWESCRAQAILVNFDDDELAALALLAAGRRRGNAARAVVVTRDDSVLRLPDAVKQRLGINDIILGPCRLTVTAEALARAVESTTTREQSGAAVFDSREAS